MSGEPASLYALKSIAKRGIVDIERAIAEGTIMQGLRHPFVVSLHYSE